MNNWYVNITGFAGDRLEGPLTTQHVKNMLDDNVINGNTQVLDPVETKNAWVKLQDTVFGDYIVQRKEEAKQQKTTSALEKRQAKGATKRSRQKNRQQDDVQITLPQESGVDEGGRTSPVIWGLPSGVAELTRLESLPADALYHRGSVTCTQCNRESGNEILLNGESMTCGWCACVNTPPLSPTNEGQKLLDGKQALQRSWARSEQKVRAIERETAQLIQSTAHARLAFSLFWGIAALVGFLFLVFTAYG